MSDQFDGGFDVDDAADDLGYTFDFEDDDGLAEGSYDDPGGWTPAELDAHLQTVAQEAVAPYFEHAQAHMDGLVQEGAEREAAERRAEEADALEDHYPELQDEDLQDRVIALTIEEAQAQAMGRPDLAGVLAKQPAFLEGVFLRNCGLVAFRHELVDPLDVIVVPMRNQHETHRIGRANDGRVRPPAAGRRGGERSEPPLRSWRKPSPHACVIQRA
jgi:hypothetical protein